MTNQGKQHQDGDQSESSPAHLYRYFATRWAESLLTQGKIFFPSPADFNDPFDCKAKVSFDASRVKRERYARDLIRERFPHMPKRDQRRLIKKAVGKESYKRAYERFLTRLQNKIGVLSFSEKGDNILMWSHYAEKHTGLCVEFSRSGYLNFTLQVQYTQEYPSLDYFRVMDDMRGPLEARYVIDRLYLSKANDWRYEKEWRLLAYAAPRTYTKDVPPDLLYGKKGLHDFPTNLITRVILGCRMPNEDKEKVKGWIRSGPANPALCEAREADGFFRLDVTEI